MVNRTKNIYNDRRWWKLRDQHMQKHPLCVRCEKQGRVKAGNVVDHVIPHRNDPALFWDAGNLQTLCHYHHSVLKQSEEKSGRMYSAEVGKDGMPLDGNHPFFSARVGEAAT